MQEQFQREVKNETIMKCAFIWKNISILSQNQFHP